MVDISIVINFHREGELAQYAIESALQSKDQAATHGIKTELIAVLDNADEATNKVVKAFRKHFSQIEEVVYKDLSHSRNHAVPLAKGKTIAFLDGDDLWGDEWLWRAYQDFLKGAKTTIYHPEINIHFDQMNNLTYQTDMRDPRFELDYFRLRNYWNSMCLAAKDVFLSVPYIKNDLANGFGYEDWLWNCDTIAQGFDHHIVKETCHLIRVKEQDSLLVKTKESGCIVAPSDLFKI